MANLRIPLPRVPPWVTRGLDRYSDWAAAPVVSVIKRRDLVSIAAILAVSGGYALYTGWWPGFMLGVAAGVFSWVLVEVSTAA
jgi:hypothetical protein